MSHKTFSLTAGVIFLLIAVAHAIRVAVSAEWIVEGNTIPMWVSWAAIIIAGYLAFAGLRLGVKSSPGP